jgi:hypothetical protein
MVAPPVTQMALGEVLDTYSGMGEFKLESTVMDDDTRGLAPLPMTIEFGVKVARPVPPYATFITFAAQVPELMVPRPMTLGRLLLTLNV